MRLTLVLLIAAQLHGQALFRSMSSTAGVPSGNTWLETWNSQNPAGLCWASGPSQCRNLWSIYGTAASPAIVTCPNAPTAKQAGKQCAQITGAATTAGAIYSYGTIPMIPVGAAVDVYAYLNFSAWSVANFASKSVLGLCQGTSGGCSSFAARLVINPSGGTLQFEGTGSTTGSRSSAISTNSWHLFQLHRDATAASCAFYLDSSLVSTFTCNGNYVNNIAIGDWAAAAGSYTVAVGNVWAVGSISGGYPPSAVINPAASGSASGIAVTTTTLAADTIGGNGAWTTAGGATAMTYSNSPSPALTYPVRVTAAGVQQNTATNSVHYQYDPSQAAESFTYTFSTPYPSCSAKFPFRYTATDATNQITLGTIGAVGGSDPIGVHFWAGTLYLNNATGTVNTTSASPNVTWASGQKFTTGTYWVGQAFTINGTGYTISSVTDSTHLVLTGNVASGGAGQTYAMTANQPAVTLSPGTTYLLSYQLNAGGQYYLAVYDATGTTLIGALARQTSDTGQCQSVCIGRKCGADTAWSGTGYFYYGPIVIDYVQARWPMVP